MCLNPFLLCLYFLIVAADTFLLDGEQYYDSDNDLWFGNKLEDSWKQCKTMSREDRNLPKSTNRLSQKLDSYDEDGTVKIKPLRLTPIIKPGVRRRMPGFLKLILCGGLCACVCLCVCPPPRLLITSGVIRCDMNHK